MLLLVAERDRWRLAEALQQLYGSALLAVGRTEWDLPCCH